ncbi:putative porin, partial [Gelidibacter japonicus]|uniref:putative porin n=1 Tax=Gelidibacter japonicus TaxID=1962232 RepID=UPI003A954CF5
MNKSFFLLALLLSSFYTVFGQSGRTGEGRDRSMDSLRSKPKVAKVEDYLIIGFDRDTTYLDTTLSLKKDYKFNYLRKDNFGLMPFSNIGQTYNSLMHDFKNKRSLPLFGARAKHFNYMEKEDINYYHVPTPLTELFYKTAFQQGQLVDAFFTINTSNQFN